MTHEIESHVGELETLRLKVRDYEEVLKFYEDQSHQLWDCENDETGLVIPGSAGQRARAILKKHGALQ